jgi:DNA polymerase-3 subunit epsilon
VPHRALHYPELSRLAHRLVAERGAPVPHEEIARCLGLTASDAASVVPHLLDGRFRPDGKAVGLWSWDLPFPPDGESVAVLDLELTGGNAKTEEIIEVGAVKLTPAGPAEFDALNDPGRPIPPFITGLTGISDRMVRGSPPLDETLHKLHSFLTGCTVVVQDAVQDLTFLSLRFARLNLELDFPLVDTLNLSRRALPGRRRRGLDALSRLYDVSIPRRHRALDDARATLAITRQLYFTLAGGRPVRLADLHDELRQPPHQIAPLAVPEEVLEK